MEQSFRQYRQIFLNISSVHYNLSSTYFQYNKPPSLLPYKYSDVHIEYTLVLLALYVVHT
jgi:hypothetical protein